MIADIDKDNSGTIDLSEFWNMMTAKMVSTLLLLLDPHATQLFAAQVPCGSSFPGQPELKLTCFSFAQGERDSREEILKAFRLFDDDETINLKRVAKELGENMTDEELQEMIDEADRNGDGEINEEKFLRIMKKTSLYYYIIRNLQYAQEKQF